MTGDATAAIVTPARNVDRESLAGLALALQTELSRFISPGTALGIWVDDAVDLALCAMGVLAVRAEGFFIPADASPAHVAQLCNIEDAAAVLCDESRASRIVGTQRACGPGLVLVEIRPPAPAGGGDQGAIHFFTSGTDGQPKGVARSRQSLELEESTVGSHLGMRPGCAVLCAVPVTHGYGYTAGLFAPLAFGGTAVVARPRLAASLATLLLKYEPEIVVAVPAQYAAWSALRRTYSGPLPRLWLCGGAPLPPAVRARFAAAWGSAIAEQYGMTECGAVTVDLDDTETLGRPYPGVTVTIDSGPSGDLGEVVVDTPYGPRGYLGESTGGGSDRFTPHGFRSGDTGSLDAHGRLRLVGRRAHQLNVRGRQVDPTEIERALWDVDGVHDVAVIGVDRAAGDQWVAAFVVCEETITDDTLQAATTRLEPFKRPQRVTRLQAIPKTPTGTDFDALRAMSRSGALTD